MHPSLTSKFSELEKITRQLLNDLSKYDHEILQIKPTEEAWSVVQVLNHLIMSENGTVRYLNKKILGIEDVRDVTIFTSIRMLVFKRVFSGTRKFKAPKVISNPGNGESLDELRQKWNETRDGIKRFLEEYPEQHMKKAIFRHPFAGRISIEQTLDFFIFHIKHHKHQINRILKNKKPVDQIN
jgi:uncharacterized damage-inducible protein DinB